jgi:putative tricarboxylic transport membrane protein
VSRTRDKQSSLIWLGVAIFVCVGSVRISLGNLHNPGPGFFTFIAGAILGVLSFAVFWQSVKGGKSEETKPLWPNPQRTLKMTWATIALILYTVGMNFIGFLFATILFLAFLLKGVDPQRWAIVGTVSILGAAVAFGVFQYWLNVQLPTGPFGF